MENYSQLVCPHSDPVEVLFALFVLMCVCEENKENSVNVCVCVCVTEVDISECFCLIVVYNVFVKVDTFPLY